MPELTERIPPMHEPTGVPTPSLNRAGRRAEARRARRLAALGSGMVLATSGAAVVMAAAPAGADTIPVTSLADSGAGSLRQALADADDGDTIDLTGLSGEIVLTTGSLEIEDGVSIVGPGPNVLTISAGGNSRIFTMYESLADGQNVTISGLTLTDGDATSDNQAAGGAIFFTCDEEHDAANDLTIDNVVLTGNTSPRLGGAIYFDHCDDAGLGNLTISNSVVAGNTSTENGAGGVWVDEGGTVTLVNTTLADNHALVYGGGGMSAYMRDIVIRSSTVSGNTSMGNGGGLYLYASESVTIANSTIAGNTASLREGDFDRGSGGGIALAGEAETVSILQTTISGNTAALVGDGLYLEGYTLDPRDVGTRGNDVGDQDAVRSTEVFGVVRLTGTIVSGNGDGTDDIGTADDEAEITAASSVLGGLSSGIVLVDDGGNQLGVTNPGLDVLADNGGPTQTMALLAGSVAIDTGPDPVPSFTGNEYDQRGPGYDRVVNGKVDVGAFEVQPIVVTPTFTG